MLLSTRTTAPPPAARAAARAAPRQVGSLLAARPRAAIAGSASFGYAPTSSSSSASFPSSAAPSSSPPGHAARRSEPSANASGVPRAGAAATGGSAADQRLADTVLLGALFGVWYLSNILFNVYNKQVLLAFSFPVTCTLVQSGIGAAMAGLFLATGLFDMPRLNLATLRTVLPLAAVHTLGNLLTNVSLGAVAVSFTHTIKAMEPFFSVLLSALFLGERPATAVLLSLVPIVGGVALASMAEATFNWVGFWAAMGSNLTFQSRNVLSKKLLDAEALESAAAAAGTPPSVLASAEGDAAAGLDNVALFSLITILSFLILIPLAFVLEPAVLAPNALTALSFSSANGAGSKLLLAGLCFHCYQQVSYMILSRVSPISHSVGNCIKRVIVIVAAVAFFGNPMGGQSIAGTGLALAGVFAYTMAKRAAKRAARAASA